MKEVLERVYAEYEEKLKDLSTPNVKRLMVYAMIATYLQREKISEEYAAKLLKEENILDYLFKTYANNRHVLYKDIKEALDKDLDK